MMAESREPHRWGYSSIGRAGALQASGQEFDSLHLHQKFASVAQKVEQLICNHQVVGSIPTAGTKARSSDGRALC